MATTPRVQVRVQEDRRVHRPVIRFDRHELAVRRPDCGGGLGRHLRPASPRDLQHRIRDLLQPRPVGAPPVVEVQRRIGHQRQRARVAGGRSESRQVDIAERRAQRHRLGLDGRPAAALPDHVRPERLEGGLLRLPGGRRGTPGGGRGTPGGGRGTPGRRRILRLRVVRRRRFVRGRFRRVQRGLDGAPLVPQHLVELALRERRATRERLDSHPCAGQRRPPGTEQDVAEVPRVVERPHRRLQQAVLAGRGTMVAPRLQGRVRGQDQIGPRRRLVGPARCRCDERHGVERRGEIGRGRQRVHRIDLVQNQQLDGAAAHCVRQIEHVGIGRCAVPQAVGREPHRGADVAGECQSPGVIRPEPLQRYSPTPLQLGQRATGVGPVPVHQRPAHCHLRAEEQPHQADG